MPPRADLPRRAEVLEALQKHGLSGIAAASAWDEVRPLISATRRRGIEHAVTHDADSGSLKGATLTGTRSSTDLRTHLARFQPGREYVQVHTHPGSTSFSANDLLVLATQPAIRAMAVVGLDGSWHLLSHINPSAPRATRIPAEAFLIEIARLEKEGVEFGERPHRAMLVVAEPHGLRYDRLGGR